ncbi:magnesium transporter [Paenibacillus pinihumi]|uniref:magnesium transporter n=1 Tax=Paenibacillus pinihumi TaxID=669462 RepID=UPI0003F84AEA|nr:magnesium transporter [Paenibacillus pinihumi]
MQNNMTEEQLQAEMRRLLESKHSEELETMVQELQPYDVATLFKDLPHPLKEKLITVLDPVMLTDLVEELGNEQQYEIFRLLGPARTVEIMDRMDNDDLAQFLGSLSEEDSRRFLSSMKLSESAAVRQLMNYPPETAGRIMNNRYVWIPQHYTVTEAIAKIRDFAEISEAISYLYVIDDSKKLLGVVSYRDLILAMPGDKIYDIMYTRVISVAVDMDQEKVADVIRNYDFLAVPVVDHDDRLIGIVTVDDIIDIVIHEANEDIQKLSGSGRDIDFNTKASVAAFRRLPWLVLLLLIGLVSGSIISQFEEVLGKVVALAYFMPMIAGMTGNTGTQSLAVVVRGLISNEITAKAVFQLIRRELLVGLIIGLTCGILVTLIAFIWQGSLMLGLIVGLSLILTLIIGTMAGTIIPLLLNKFKIDPAVASGPLITTLNDVLSLFIYFGIASMFLKYLL